MSVYSPKCLECLQVNHFANLSTVYRLKKAMKLSEMFTVDFNEIDLVLGEQGVRKRVRHFNGQPMSPASMSNLSGKEFDQWQSKVLNQNFHFVNSLWKSSGIEFSPS